MSFTRQRFEPVPSARNFPYKPRSWRHCNAGRSRHLGTVTWRRPRAGKTQAPSGADRSLDGDPFRGGAGLLGQLKGQDAILVLGLDFCFIDILRQGKSARYGTFPTFAAQHLAAVSLGLFLLLGLGLNPNDIAIDLHIDIVFFHATYC